MAAAIDVGAVSPSTLFNDTGEAMVEGWPKPIRNAENKKYGMVDMTTVLEESINTGMIFSMRQMGGDIFADAVKKFGFGKKTGVELATESVGDISSMEKKSEIYRATASFGQGISVTPLQVVMAYAAVANGHGKRAGVPGYYIAGKTGTAQVASESGGYELNNTIGSFAGFGPVEDPKFAMR